MSIWLDDISRERLRTGNLAGADPRPSTSSASPPTRRSSPRRCSKGDAYDDAAARPGRCAASTWRRPSGAITTYDIRWACDVLRPAYDATGGVDGRVSIEVDPRLARDTDDDRRRGPRAVVAGGPAQPVHQDPGHRARACPRSPQALAEGISVNVTLIFSLERYRAGDRRLARPAWSRPRRPATTCRRSRRWRRSSSAGWTPRSTSGWTRSAPPEALALRGKAAIANARLAYAAFEEVVQLRPRWQALRRRRRPAAASAVGVHRREEPRLPRHHLRRRLVTPDTVNTMPEKTLDAVADHGQITRRHGPRLYQRRPGVMDA